MYVGKLDSKGNFTYSVKLEAGAPSSGASGTLINAPGTKPRPAYEFRSGRLIKGEIATDGNFVPEAGSRVIKFEDYKYSPDAIPIWNLPGYFKKKSEMGKDAKK